MARSVNCTINLEQDAFCVALLAPDNAGSPPKLYAGTVAEPHRLRFILDQDAPTGGGSITIYVPKMATWTGRTLMDGEGPQIDLQPGQPLPFEGRPTPVARGPLPPFPPGHYDETLTQAIPPAPNLRWWRGNAWAVTIPGLPFVPGGSSETPDQCLTWFLDRWSPDWQQTILDTYAQRGYTHFILSWPDSRSVGQSIEQFAQTCQRVQAIGCYACVFLGSKDYDPHDQWWDGWNVAPVIDALIAAKAMDIAIVGWELDLWNIPGDPLQSIVDGVTQRTVPAGIPTYVHFSTHVTWWGKDGSDRFAWWNLQRGKLTGLLYQGDSAWDVGLFQARMVDTLAQFAHTDSGFGHPFDDIAFETKASAQFDGPADENTGDLMDYLLLCTQAGVSVQGFGNGARMPDGSVI